MTIGNLTRPYSQPLQFHGVKQQSCFKLTWGWVPAVSNTWASLLKSTVMLKLLNALKIYGTSVSAEGGGSAHAIFYSLLRLLCSNGPGCKWHPTTHDASLNLLTGNRSDTTMVECIRFYGFKIVKKNCGNLFKSGKCCESGQHSVWLIVVLS